MTDAQLAEQFKHGEHALDAMIETHRNIIGGDRKLLLEAIMYARSNTARGHDMVAITLAVAIDRLIKLNAKQN
jgi:hypothetical protein